MKRKIKPASLRALYRDFLEPSGSHQCYACNRPLKTGIATFLLADSAPQAFGPQCAEDYAVTSLRGLPDHTKGMDFPERLLREEDAPSELPSPNFAKASASAVHRERKSQHTEELGKAVIYASLRCDRLLKLGFRTSGLSWKPLEDFYKSHQYDRVTDRELSTVLTTMKSTETKTNVQFLSFDNLRACYLYGWVIEKIFAECSPKRKLTKEDYSRLCSLRNSLRKDMFLSRNECIEVLRIAKNNLKRPPTAIHLSFVASRPAFTVAPKDELKL